MQKQFIKVTGIIIILAMLITILVAFSLQTLIAYIDSEEKLNSLLNEVEVRLEENEKSILELKQNLNKDYLTRTYAFAYMIDQNPSLIESSTEMDKILELLDVDELYVTDEKGIIRWSTVANNVGFDMGTSQQTIEFMPLLTNDIKELAQEPQLNGTKGILFQYIGVSRIDKTGIIQIGMQPTRLESALENNKIGKVLERFNSESEMVSAINLSDNTIEWSKDNSLIGKSASDMGLHKEINSYLNGYTTEKINGQNCRISARTIGNYVIVSQIMLSDMLGPRNMQLIVLLISDLLVVLIMIWQIDLQLKKQIVVPISNIDKELHKIACGDLKVSVDIDTCPEFILLSEGINAMVGGIRSKMEETENLLNNQRKLSIKMEKAAGNLSKLSDDNLGTSNQIADGATEQADSMDALITHITKLAEQMEQDSKKALEAGEIAEVSRDSLIRGDLELKEMVEFIHKISEISSNIKDVVKTIDNISFQTNILALNAAVEAARAGSAGKGFSVVADEVRMLARKSTEAAKRTEEMIGHTIKSIDDGEMMAKKTATTIHQVIEQAKESTRLTNEIANATEGQTSTIAQIKISGNRISEVIQQNSRLAKEGREGVAEMLEEIQELRKLAGNP